tara:strand:+ start:2981 stop:4069 length:1089 start_codon:yes stop_codon:yes gene_type:complete
MVQQYLDHCKEVLTSPHSGFKGGSKGSGLISLFGYQNEYDLRKGFPLITTKKMFKNSMIHELIWFIRGDSNIKYLEDNKAPIWRGNAFEYNLKGMVEKGIFPKKIVKYSKEWDKAMDEYGQRIRENPEFAAEWGNAGPIYGRQWRHWKHIDEDGKISELDQLGDVLENMKKKPLGKKHIISSWNHGDIPSMSLPPCHVMFQMTANEEEEMDLQLYQRSCDMFLGVPFNIGSYALLTHMVSQKVGLKPRRFIHTFGDSHFYSGLKKRSQWYKENSDELKDRVKNVSDREEHLEVLEWINKNAPSDPTEERYDHITAILEQLSREPRKLPKLHIAKKDLYKLTIEDFKIEDYTSHNPIRRTMAV